MQLNRRFMLGVPLAAGLGLGVGIVGCTDPDPGCNTGSFGCACYPGNVCLGGLTCLSGICVQFVGEGETSDGDGDADSGPGDGDSGPGDGDSGPGDGDGDSGDGDGDTGPGEPCEAGAPIVLYSQGEGEQFGSGVLAGAFTDLNDSSLEVADDFVVPQNDGCWCITEIVVNGAYKDAIEPAATPNFYVEILNDGASVPTGAPIASEYATLSNFIEGDFTVPLMGLAVPAGTHWLSVRPELASEETLWYWSLRTEQTGDMLATRDLDAIVFQGACTVWTPGAACFTGLTPPYVFDLHFEIRGTVLGGDACN